MICIIKICTFRADSGPGRSSLALGSAVSGPGPGPCPGIYLCKHIITNAKSQKPQFKVDLCLTVSPLTLVRLIPQQSEEWQMGEEKSVRWKGGGEVTRTKCTPRSHANQSLAFYCRNPIWHIYKGSVWGLWLANLIIDGCLLRLASLFANMRVEVLSSKYLWQLGDPSPPLAVPHCRLMIPQRAIFKVPNAEWTCCPLYFPMISQPPLHIPLSPSLSLPLSLSSPLFLSVIRTRTKYLFVVLIATQQKCVNCTLGKLLGSWKYELVFIFIAHFLR